MHPSLKNLIDKYPKLLDKKGRLNACLISCHPEIYESIKEEFEKIGLGLNYDIGQGFCLLKNNIIIFEKCTICDNIARFNKGKFTPYCSWECANSEKAKKQRLQNSKNTCIERYGVENPLQDKQIKGKANKTLEEKYGGIGLSSKIIRETIENTNQEKYGVKNVFQADCVKEKIKETNKERFGVEYYSQIHITKEILLKLNCKEFLTNIVNSDLSFSEHALQLGITTTTLIDYLRKNGFQPNRKSSSSLERILLNELKLLNLEVIQNNRTILNGKEIDLYIPEFKLGIEINGLYWHSEKFDSSNSKNVKQKMAENKNIKLLHLYEDTINDNLLGAISIIKKFTNKNNQICFDKKKINDNNINEFLMCYSIEKYQLENIMSNITYYCNNKIICTILFQEIDNCILITNICTKFNVCYKNFLEDFIKTNNKKIKFISNNDYLEHLDFIDLGFKINKILPPNATYFNIKYGAKRYKSKINDESNWLKIYNSGFLELVIE